MVGRRGLPTILAGVLAGVLVVGCGAPLAAAPGGPLSAAVPGGPPSAAVPGGPPSPDPTNLQASAAIATAPDAGDATPPARIRLPSLDVDAAVVAVGVDERGEMAVPEDIRETGWYRFGPAPGSVTGSSVVSGHVDDRVQGRGAFYRLVDLAVGDPVIVTTTAGVELDYRVSTVRRIPKTALPVDELFARDGPPHLTLVTCGGVFDRASGNYRDNVVVTASPDGFVT
jgi:LPXTG-site transpeptidase (sortase) family protein